MNYGSFEIWAIILLIGIGTLVLRYSFLGIIGSRALPEWVLRHLRYTPVAVIPGLMAPLIFFPPVTDGETDPGRLAVAAAALGAGVVTRSPIWAIVAGLAVAVLLSLTNGLAMPG
ncbi:MAG: AzlD domain-containing protein [Pararhodobacter sp.]|nr:AzlD domain-containing protein [Pararhodobacter sp.]